MDNIDSWIWVAFEVGILILVFISGSLCTKKKDEKYFAIPICLLGVFIFSMLAWGVVKSGQKYSAGFQNLRTVSGP